MKVLIIDDRAENQALLREQLRSVDATSVTAESGARALRELRSQPFDLVVTDLLMPEMDGMQLCYLLKTDPILKDIPVVITPPITRQKRMSSRRGIWEPTISLLGRLTRSSSPNEFAE